MGISYVVSSTSNAKFSNKLDTKSSSNVSTHSAFSAPNDTDCSPAYSKTDSAEIGSTSSSSIIYSSSSSSIYYVS